MLVVAFVCASACGRTDIDAGFGVTNITTGAGGADGVIGAAGNGVPAGTGGVPGAPMSRAPIPCGNATCAPETQICCVREQRRGSSETCIKATETCTSGASVGCLTGASCGAGQVCCESLLSPATTCAAPDACLRTPGVILCAADKDCPSITSHCCQTDNGGICSAQACPAGGGGGFDGPQSGPQEGN